MVFDTRSSPEGSRHADVSRSFRLGNQGCAFERQGHRLVEERKTVGWVEGFDEAHRPEFGGQNGGPRKASTHPT